jgi:hypothetical protein
MYIKNILKYLLRKISRFGCYSNLPIITFCILRIFIKKILDKKAQNKNNILILPKSGGREDIHASFKEKINNCLIFELPRAEIKNIYNFFIKSNKVTNYRYYHDDDEILNQKKKYKDFLSKLLIYFKKFYKINLIINFNFTYKEEIELAKASRERNIKFLTIHKESQASDGKRLINEIVYKNSIRKYFGDCIAVYNEFEKTNILNSGIIKEKFIKVIGSPRVDFSFHIKKEKKNSKKIHLIYFCIQTSVSLPIYEGEFRTEGIFNIQKFNWSNLAEETENVLINYKNKFFSDVEMIFKTKTGNDDQVERLKKIDTSNIKVIYNNTGHHLLKKADVIVAFNSTIIFEAIAADIPVIIPYFNLTVEQKKFVFNLSNVEDIYFMEKFEDLEKILRIIKNNKIKLKKRKIKTKNQKDILNKYVGNSDGKSGYRLRNLIKEINV